MLTDAVAYDVLVSGATLVILGFMVGAAFGTVADRKRDRLRSFVTRNPPLWAVAAGLVAPEALAPRSRWMARSYSCWRWSRSASSRSA